MFYIVDVLGEKEMATHSSVLAWRIPGTGEPGGLPSMGSHRVGHDWSALAAAADVLGKKFLIIFTTYKICELNYSSGKLQFLCISTWPGSCDPKEDNNSTFLLCHLCHLHLIHLRLGLCEIGLWGNNRGKCENGAK